MIIIGSTAMKHYNPKWDEPKDLDVVYSMDYDFDKEKHKDKDAHLVPFAVYHTLEEFSRGGYLTPWGCYNLKVSHALFDVKWFKTAKDIIRLQNEYGFKEVDDKFFNVLYPFWMNYHKAKKRPLTGLTNAELFRDKVKRQYPHDLLHECVKYGYQPWFYDLKENLNNAECSFALFDKMPLVFKYQFIREEIYVVALERFLIPGGFKIDPVDAYRRAIHKLCTTMTEGWWPKFLIEHLTELKNPDIDYVKRFNEKKVFYLTEEKVQRYG